LRKRLVLKKNPDIVSREIEGEIILLPIYKTSEEINCIYTLNKSAAKIWELIDGKRTIKEMAEIILEKFDTTSEEIDKKLTDIIKDLEDINAVV